MQIGEIVMSVAIVQYGAIPLLADLNRSHALNPDWPPHARFHVTAQVCTTSLVALFAVALLWWPTLGLALRASLSALASGAVIGGFFCAVVASRAVGGAVAAPGAARFGGFDGNAINFAVSGTLTLAGWLLTR